MNRLLDGHDQLKRFESPPPLPLGNTFLFEKHSVAGQVLIPENGRHFHLGSALASQVIRQNDIPHNHVINLFVEFGVRNCIEIEETGDRLISKTRLDTGTMIGLRVGAVEGLTLGKVVGSAEGCCELVGIADGDSLAVTVGGDDGANVGTSEGDELGIPVGLVLGRDVGVLDGDELGLLVGRTVGAADGEKEGVAEGSWLGLSVGTSLG